LKANTLQAVAILSFLANNIENEVNQLSSLRVVPLGPVVSGTGLTEDKVIRPKDLSIRTRSETIHGSGLQIHKHSPRNEPSTARLIVVHIDPLQLQICFPMVTPCGVDAVLGANHFPELGTDLVAERSRGVLRKEEEEKENLGFFFLMEKEKS